MTCQTISHFSSRTRFVLIYENGKRMQAALAAVGLGFLYADFTMKLYEEGTTAFNETTRVDL